MKFHEALKVLRNNPEIRHVNDGICSNLSRVYNPKNEPDKQLKQQQFLRAAFTHIYGKNYAVFPIEKGYTEYYLNKDKWDSSTEYGKARLELLDKMIYVAEQIEELPVVQFPVDIPHPFL